LHSQNYNCSVSSFFESDESDLPFHFGNAESDDLERDTATVIEPPTRSETKTEATINAVRGWFWTVGDEFSRIKEN
jgi:hypothetical protein